MIKTKMYEFSQQRQIKKYARQQLIFRRRYFIFLVLQGLVSKSSFQKNRAIKNVNDHNLLQFDFLYLSISTKG
jgi:hypothetical protein